LPESPINDIIVDPDNITILYIATDVGVFVTGNLGISWDMLGSNLPNVPVTDIALHNNSRKLIAATYGRSMYTYDLYQDTITTDINQVNLIADNNSLRVNPNPFKFSTKIFYNSPKIERGIVEVYDLSGRKIYTLFRGDFEKGVNEFIWQPYNIEHKINLGIYIITVEICKNRISQKIIYNGS